MCPSMSGGISEERVREELERILASHEFRSSKRSQDFLRYVTENTLRGHADMLKERTIGIEVFGRSTSYEPSDDATVRVRAGEVRKRLGIYYSSEGARAPLRIELPAGTYIPEFRPVTVQSPANGAPHPVTAPWITPRRSALATAIVAAAAALAWIASRTPVTLLD